MTPWAALRRGFVPAGELAAPLARAIGIPLGRRVVRRRWRGPVAAKRLGARGRRRLGPEAFRVDPEVRGRRVLLVDDVMTTGAMADACTRALRRAGATEVRVAVWARTLPGAKP